MAAAPAPCLARAVAVLTNVEGAHRVHGWDSPLTLANVSLGMGQTAMMATFTSIGSPHPYVHDQVSLSLRSEGRWDVSDPHDIAAAAGVQLPTHDGRTFLDVGAQLGYYSLAFARRGFRVVAIEPLLLNALALEASVCLEHSAPRIAVLHTAAVSRDQSASGSCAVLSPWRGVSNDFGNGVLECINRTSKSFGQQCSRKHNGKVLASNFTYFFHYRRFCQQVAAPLRTLDEIVAEHDAATFSTSGTAATSVDAHSSQPQHPTFDVAKVDTAGSECDVLDGGVATLSHTALLMINVETGRSRACAEQFAARHGFQIYPWVAASRRAKPGQHVVLSRIAR